MADPAKRNKMIKSGWHDPKAITYNYNSHGFRDEEFDERPCGLAMGCSFTHGTGIQQMHTWPHQLSRMVDLHFWNLGIGGASLDTVFRMFRFYSDVLNSKVVAILLPARQRMEYCEGDGRYVTVLPEDVQNNHHKSFFKEWFSSDENGDLNREKNLLSIRKHCEDHGIKLIYIDPLTEWYKVCEARDLAHPDADSNLRLAEQFAKKF